MLASRFPAIKCYSVQRCPPKLALASGQHGKGGSSGCRGVWGPHLVVVPTSVMLNWEVCTDQLHHCWNR